MGELRRALVGRRGVHASKLRPAVVGQDDRFDGTYSITVCPLTTTEASAFLLRVRIAPDEMSGLAPVSTNRGQGQTTLWGASLEYAAPL